MSFGSIRVVLFEQGRGAREHFARHGHPGPIVDIGHIGGDARPRHGHHVRCASAAGDQLLRLSDDHGQLCCLHDHLPSFSLPGFGGMTLSDQCGSR